MISSRLTGFVVLPLTMAVAGVSAIREDAVRLGCCMAAASGPAQRVGRDDDFAAPIQAHAAIEGTFFDLD